MAKICHLHNIVKIPKAVNFPLHVYLYNLALVNMCPVGWTPSDTIGECYRTLNKPPGLKSQAEADCRMMGGQLVSINNVAERESVTRFVTRNFGLICCVLSFSFI